MGIKNRYSRRNRRPIVVVINNPPPPNPPTSYWPKALVAIGGALVAFFRWGSSG